MPTQFFRKLAFLTLAFALGALASAVVVHAQESIPTDDEVNAVAKNLYCPVCPNTPLDVCETKACQDWREQIRGQLAQGWTEEEITTYFVEQYGERVLAEPKRSGFTSLVWLLPVFGVAFGGLAVWQLLKDWQLKKETLPGRSITEAGMLDPELRAKIEKELQELD